MRKEEAEANEAKIPSYHSPRSSEPWYPSSTSKDEREVEVKEEKEEE